MTDRRQLELDALYEGSRIFAGSTDMDLVLSTLLFLSMGRIKSARGLIYLRTKQGAFELAHQKGPSGWQPAKEVSVPPTLLTAGLIPYENLPKDLAAEATYVWCIDSPDECIGILALSESVGDQPIESSEFLLVQSLIRMATASIINMRLVDELKRTNRSLDRRNQTLNTLFELSGEFGQATDRAKIGQLLSWALMGQLLVQKYIFVRRRGNAAADEEPSPLMLASAQGFSDSDAGHLMPLLDQIQDATLLTEEDHKELFDSGLRVASPLKQGDITEGVIALGPKMTGRDYLPQELEFLTSLGSLAVSSIKNTYLIQEQIQREKLAEEMRLAREIQMKLLPQYVPQIECLEISTFATPSSEVSGDYFDVLQCRNGDIVVAIADVTGKGVPASLLMSNIQAALRVLLPLDLPLNEATLQINNVIHKNTGFDKFITFFWLRYSPVTKQIEYVNAGHDQPICINQKGDILRLEEGGLLLGVMPGSVYDSGSIRLDDGDIVALFTDGVTEAMNPEAEEYGEERLLEVMHANKDKTADEISKAVRDSVREFINGAAQSDDITLIVLRKR